MGSILWTIIIGAIVGMVAKFIMPGSNEPKGFVMTAILGIVGSLLATYGGQALGLYSAAQGAGFIWLIGWCHYCVGCLWGGDKTQGLISQRGGALALIADFIFEGENKCSNAPPYFLPYRCFWLDQHLLLRQ
jgi:uncharacterized membrane protein YeaQ/YmgE (transglycosylase-associated protein family)